MSEMRRLKEETRSPFTRSLLASVEADRADSGACDRALGALGLGAGVAAASTAAKAAALGSGGAKGASGGAASIAPAAAKGGALLLAKWIGIGVIGGAMAIGSAQYARRVVASSSQHLRASATVGSDPRAASPSPISSLPDRLDPLLTTPLLGPGPAVPPEVSPSAIVVATNPTISRNTASFPSRARKVWPSGAREDRTSPGLIAPRSSELTTSPSADVRAQVSTSPPSADVRAQVSTSPPSADVPSTPLERGRVDEDGLAAAAAPGPVVPTRLPAADSVTRQLESLSAIRAVGFGAPQRVLVLLDDFERRYPSSPLREEVAVLRIDALVDAGRRAEGVTLARAFLAAHPASAYAQHVRSKVKSP